jgi:hypothetical protein
MMKNTIAASLTMLALAACGGGGGGSPPPSTVASLAGTWVGQYVELDAPPIGGGPAARIALVLDQNGAITQILVDGQPSGVGEVRPVPGVAGIFDYEFSAGGIGGFYVDPTGRYAAAVDENGTIALLQRGGPALPNYAIADVVGAWAGESVFVDQGLGYEDRVPSQVSVQADGTFSGTEAGQPFAALDELDFYSGYGGDASLAFWFARFTSVQTADGIGRFLMSPDKQFLAGFAGENGGMFPGDFSFPVWRRQ